MNAQIETVLSRLDGVKPAGAGKWMAKCPAHDDSQASLSIREADDGRVLLNCFSGCNTEDIASNLELSMGDLFPPKVADQKPQIAAVYSYRDGAGNELYQAIRLIPKSFRQRHKVGDSWVWKMDGVHRVLYRLPEISAAGKDAIVWVVEGEKDADRLTSLGAVATTNIGGAGKWNREYSEALRGRDVVILPDNDDPGRKHAVEVATSLTGVARSVKVLALSGLPPKGDVSDWLASGGTYTELVELAKSAPVGVPKAHLFKPSVARLSGERAERLLNARSILTFGVRFLDDALGGITRGDLILYGAKSGVGKTALATITSLANCRKGKRAHYFALEAEEREIERRMKFQIIADLYYSNRFGRKSIRFQDWYNGLLDQELGPYEEQADESLARILANLSTFYRDDNFTSDNFREQFEAIREETDLAVLDHFHYIDDDESKDDNRSAKKTVKQIRDCVLRAKKPVIVVAHVRKADRKNSTLVPELEDFHGSSDIPKIATKAVMLAPAFDVPNPAPYLWPTYMMAAKNRTDMSATRYTALVNFNTRQNSYESVYTLGRLTDAGKKFTPLELSELPAWANPGAAAEQRGLGIAEEA